MHESYRNPLPLHGVGGVEDEHSRLDSNGSSRGPYDILTIEGEFFKSNCLVNFALNFLV